MKHIEPSRTMVVLKVFELTIPHCATMGMWMWIHSLMNDCAEVHRLLAVYGLLLLQDKSLPSVAGIFAGKGLTTSWWSHPRAQEIFICLDRLEPSEASVTRLLSGKVTYVHKHLYPDLACVGSAKDPWQMKGLSIEGRNLLASVKRRGSFEATGHAARELQGRLLVAAEEVHTTAGHHETRLETWPSWAARMGVKPMKSPEEARGHFEAAAEALGARPQTLPWHRMQRPGRRRAV